MITRQLPLPKKSIMLLGPRGTGKSTWIRQHFPDVATYDLLNTSEALRLSKTPSLLYQELSQSKAHSWVVIDEVQKVPALLDEVHRLMEQHRLRFILSGSSARKLKRGGANLLAGRAIRTQMFPLVSAEVAFQRPIDQALRFGMLPQAVTTKDPTDYLRTYAEVYLQEEIRAEALTRSIGNFARFLEIAARQNGQTTNVTSIARDATIARQTVAGYFDMLVDTLIGDWLTAWKLKRTTKQIAHPKFYFFDAGVTRALSGRLPYPPSPEEMGALLETWLLGGRRAYLHSGGLHYPVHYGSSHYGVEVDFVCETQQNILAIECKPAPRWDAHYNKGLLRLTEELGKDRVRCIGVYRGERDLHHHNIHVMPVMSFLKRLWNGEIMK